VNAFQIASVCHEANRAYCATQGDLLHDSWEDTDPAIQATTVAGVRHALDHPGVSARGMHENWCKDKTAAGWVYGETKDAEKKTHPCLVPYEQLPPHDRFKDELFLAIVGVLAEA
jgi:hypothetical protein